MAGSPVGSIKFFSWKRFNRIGEMVDNGTIAWLPKLGNLPPLREYPAEVDLFHQEEPVEHPYLLETGVVKLWFRRSDGFQFIVNLSFPGRLLGAASVVLAKPSAVTATTLTRCRLRRLPAESFLSVLTHDCALAGDLHRILSTEVAEYIDRTIELACRSATDRLLRLFSLMLGQLVARPPTKEVLLPALLRAEEMAGMVGVTREHLSRILTDLEDRGVIRRCKGRIVVLQFDKIPRLMDIKNSRNQDQ